MCDVAKKNITQLRNDYGIESESGLVSYINELKNDRDKIYKKFTVLQRDQTKEREQEKKKVKKKCRRL